MGWLNPRVVDAAVAIALIQLWLEGL